MVADWRTAPLSPQLTATLEFLERLALRPDELQPEDAERVFEAGVSEQALRDAAAVCSLFSMIVRLADALGWDVPEWDTSLARALAMLEGGYSLGATGSR